MNSELELRGVRSTSGIDWHVPRGRGLILRSTGWCQSQTLVRTPNIMIVWNVTRDWTCREEYIEKINEMPEFDTSMILEYKNFRGRSKSCETSMGFEHWNDVLVELNSRYLSGSIDFIQHFKSTTSLGWKIFLPVDLLFGRRLRMILCGNWWP